MVGPQQAFVAWIMAWNSIPEPWRREVDGKVSMKHTHSRHLSLKTGRTAKEDIMEGQEIEHWRKIDGRIWKEIEKDILSRKPWKKRIQGNWRESRWKPVFVVEYEKFVVSKQLRFKKLFLRLRGRKWQSLPNSFLKLGRLSNVGPYLPYPKSWELGSIDDHRRKGRVWASPRCSISIKW